MRNFVLGFLAAALLLTGGYFIHSRWTGNPTVRAAPKTLYHCPMHPTYISDKPGDCPICGMKLVPMEPGTPSSLGSQTAAIRSTVPGYVPVTIPPDRIQSMGITITKAARLSLDQSFRTFGRVTYDETRVHHVHTRVGGYIESLYADYTGQFVTKGQPLFSFYSPELYATENEYLLALRARDQKQQSKGGFGALYTRNAADLAAAARERLSLWNIGENEILDLERTRKPSRALIITSPVSGYVTAKTAVQGLKVTPSDNLYDIVDLSTVWVLADVYEVNLPSVKVGQAARIELDYRPGKTWTGRVVFIDPTVDPATRTIKARLEFPNPEGELKPEMYAHVTIGGSRGTATAIPESAVVATGERNIVFVARGGGTFEPREVVLGTRVGNLYEIRQGLAEGEEVATGANFLLDSESKLKAAASAGTE
jgi:Cu(I)/Ag(I) efflux system membrane fusion protein